MRYLVNVKTRSKRTGVTVLGSSDKEMRLSVAVKAAPIEGKANEAVIKLLAEHFGVAPSLIILERGATTKNKIFKINGR